MRAKKEINQSSIQYDESMDRFEVLSDTHAGHRYSVYWDLVTDQFVCTCPHGRGYGRKKNNPCKHVTGVLKWIDNHQEFMTGRDQIAQEQ
jgi:hypothetical protein